MSQITRVAAAVIAAAVIAAGLATTTDARPTVYTSGDSGERTTYLRVTAPGATYATRVVYCVDLRTAPAAGEVLHVDAEMEVTNDLGFNVMVATQLLLAYSCDHNSGIEIGEANASNVTPDMHHGVASHSVSVITPATTSRYVILLAWATASKATPASTIRVEQDFGTLSVLRWP